MASHVADRVVWDLGAGDLVRARHMLDLGAREVVAVDKGWYDTPDAADPRLRPITAYFEAVEVPDSIEVVFLGWPMNYPMPGLSRLLDVAEVVIYLGSNTGGSACGSPGLHDLLRVREPLAYEEHRRNTLIVYGNTPRESPLLAEEFAAMDGTLFLTLDDARKAMRATGA